MIAYRYNIFNLLVLLLSALSVYSKLIALEPIEVAIYNNPDDTSYEYVSPEIVKPTQVARNEYESYSRAENTDKKEEETLASALELLEDIVSTIHKSAEKLGGSVNHDVDQRSLCQKIYSKGNTRRLRRVLTALCGNPNSQETYAPQPKQPEDNRYVTESSENSEEKIVFLDGDETVELIPVDIYEIV